MDNFRPRTAALRASSAALSISTPDVNSVSVPQAFSITEINTLVADALAATLPGVLWVEGEMSNLSVAASGHRYFSLKDAQSTISCALFRGTANRLPRQLLTDLKNGDHVTIQAKLSVFKPRGSYQLIVSHIEPQGFGALAKAFVELKSRLDQAGLTASERKRALPTWPQTIAVVTSDGGAAIRDILTTLQRRAPFIPIHLFPTMVQGEQAPVQIIQALAQANADEATDVIILARGGGSLEDLQAFNDEGVAVAVADSDKPVITGVGHETDFTIVDFVSDYRAATPTAAAEIVAPDRRALLTLLHRQSQRLAAVIQGGIGLRRQQLQGLAQRLAVQHPDRQQQQQSQRLDELSQRLARCLLSAQVMRRRQLWQLQQRLQALSPQQQWRQSHQQLNQYGARLQQVAEQNLRNERQQLLRLAKRLQRLVQQFDRHRQQLKGLQARLLLLSPLGVLERGYTLVFDSDGQLLSRAQGIDNGQMVRIRFADAELLTQVQQKI